jgi:hypothetical protein
VSLRSADAIERYLRTGKCDDINHLKWPGQSIIEKSRNGHDDHVRALVAEVKKRSNGRKHATVPELDLGAWTRHKLTPMVHGFFPEAEREAILRLFEKSIVFLTSDNIESVLFGQMWLHSAWDLANLYLGSVDAELLGPDAPSLLGLSQETTCYVTADYFADRGRIEDFVIHEAAHVFHNCKRKTAGLTETRTKEWLLLLEFSKRETFAYSCEAFGWIIEHSSSKAERLALGERFAAHGFGQCDESMDPSEVSDIVEEACHARNGWKVILKHCAPEKRSMRQSSAAMSIGER